MSDAGREPTLVPLPDGRVLAVDDVGDRNGAVVVFLHGTPSSRLGRPPLDASLPAGVRLLAIDRPGIGRSTPDPSTSTAAFARDLGVVLDQLGVDGFRILAWSAGAIWALAAAVPDQLGARLRGITIAAGLVPVEAFADPALRAACHPGREGLLETVADLGPEETAEFVAPMLVPYPATEEIARDHLAAVREMHEARELASVPGGEGQGVLNLLETVRQGLNGVARDLVVQTSPFGLDLASITVPTRLVYGTADVTCPPAFGEWYAARLPTATLEIIEGAAHGFPFVHWLDLVGGR